MYGTSSYGVSPLGANQFIGRSVSLQASVFASSSVSSAVSVTRTLQATANGVANVMGQIGFWQFLRSNVSCSTKTLAILSYIVSIYVKSNGKAVVNGTLGGSLWFLQRMQESEWEELANSFNLWKEESLYNKWSELPVNQDLWEEEPSKTADWRKG